MIDNLETQNRWVSRTKPMIPGAEFTKGLMALSSGPVFNPGFSQNRPIIHDPVNVVNDASTVSVSMITPATFVGEKRPVVEIESDDELDRLLSKKPKSKVSSQVTKTGTPTGTAPISRDRMNQTNQTRPSINQTNGANPANPTINTSNFTNTTNPTTILPNAVQVQKLQTSTSRSSSSVSSSFIRSNTSNPVPNPLKSSGTNGLIHKAAAAGSAASNVKSFSTEELYQKYINFLELKTALLTERYLTFESSSLSLTDKQKFLNTEFEPKYNSIEINLINLRKLLPLNIMSLSQLVESVPEVSQIQQNDIYGYGVSGANGVNRVSGGVGIVEAVNGSVDASSLQVEDSLPPMPHSEDDFEITQVNVLKENVIELPSDDNNQDHLRSSPKRPEVPTFAPTFEVPVTPTRVTPGDNRNRQDGNVYISRDEDEDEFGEREMEGLRTPTQEVDNADTDLSGFVVDEESQGSGSESESDYSVEESFPIDRDELNDMKLSQDVAENFGISYGDVSGPVDEPVGNGFDPMDNFDDQMGNGFDNFDGIDNEDNVDGPGNGYDTNDNPDYEEIDEFFSTQLNDEREVNHEIIEISDGDFDDFDDEFGLINPSIIKPMIKEEKTKGKEQTEREKMGSFDDFDDFDDSDDELISMGITTSRDIIREQERNHPGCEVYIKEVYHILNKKFGLQNFRSNQFEAIISFLQGLDVFVLMPTGGGKSLCYQLPALVKVGKNQGVTIVISPLISLMKDQVEHLKRKDIKAEMINSKIPEAEKRVTTDLFRTGQLDLIYLSPEMINASKSIQRIIQQLYDSKMLNKIIVDEAHCISSWGHDFRPDYKGMNFFRKKYPDVPIMALTATANEKVKMDIVHLLEMQDAKILKQSFNRINLYYDIRMKGGGYVDEIRDLIVNKYKGQTGIIYCHSKQSCENISSKLNGYGLHTAFYHAGMSTEDRFQVQNQWQEESIKVICATIAFGMGIDKPNVRFVIHSFIPRTLEGYYQETGRAGRDGLKSDCILYYSYKDARNLQMMIQRDEDYNEVTKENHLNKLRQVIQYCENKHDCRRKQVLKYFNEDFNPKDCNKQCDACSNKNSRNEKFVDYTDIAKNVIKLVESIENDRVTLLYCQDVFKGSNNAKIVKNGHTSLPYHGMGKTLTKLELERVFFHLVCENSLMEYSIMRGGFASNYVKIGKNAADVLNGRVKVKIKVSQDVPAATTTAKSTSGAVGNGFVSAKTNEPIRLPTNNFNNYVNPRNERHIEKSYHELNLIRNKRRIELNFQNANNIISDSSLKKLAIMLPTSKVDFKKFVSNNDQLEYFIYFKTKLAELSRERKALMTATGPVQGQRNQFVGQGAQGGQRGQGGQGGQRSSQRSQKPRRKQFGKNNFYKKRKQKAMPL